MAEALMRTTELPPLETTPFWKLLLMVSRSTMRRIAFPAVELIPLPRLFARVLSRTLIVTVIVTAPNPPGSMQLISPLGAVCMAPCGCTGWHHRRRRRPSSVSPGHELGRLAARRPSNVAAKVSDSEILGIVPSETSVPIAGGAYAPPIV